MEQKQANQFMFGEDIPRDKTRQNNIYMDFTSSPDGMFTIDMTKFTGVVHMREFPPTKEGDKPFTKIGIQVNDKADDGSFKEIIVPMRVYDQLKLLKKTNSSLTHVKVLRTGTARQTQYTVVPIMV